MNIYNITAGLLKPQRCARSKFFYILTTSSGLSLLNDAAAGPKKRCGRYLRELRANICLLLWCYWCRLADTDNLPTVTSLHRELEDPESDLFQLCGFEEGKKPPTRKTISNHFKRMNKHPDLVRGVLREINQRIPPGACIAQSQKPKKSEKAKEEPGSQKGWEPKDRNEENVVYRRRRREEAAGLREISPFLADKTATDDFFRDAINGGSRSCYICRNRMANGRSCDKDHQHGVVVELRRTQDQPRQWKCRCCQSRMSDTSGTVFHGTKFSSQDIFIALYEMIKSRHGVSSQDVAGALNEKGRNVSEGAARDLMHRLRECMREDGPGRFDGETELDEVLLKLCGGRSVSVVSFYNRPTGCVRFEIVERDGGTKPKANKREMFKFIRKHTLPRSTILSDGDATLRDGDSDTPIVEVAGRKHGQVIHKRFQFLKCVPLNGKDIEVTSNRVEGKQSHLRRTLRFRNGISRHHLERYLAEAAWRINHLHNRGESEAYDGGERRILSLMRDVIAGAAGRKMTLRDLRGKPQKRGDRIRERNRTAPVTASTDPQQPPLMASTPTVLGALQFQRGQVKAKPNQNCPTQLTLAFGDSQAEDEQPQQVPPEETGVWGKAA